MAIMLDCWQFGTNSLQWSVTDNSRIDYSPGARCTRKFWVEICKAEGGIEIRVLIELESCERTQVCVIYVHGRYHLVQMMYFLLLWLQTCPCSYCCSIGWVVSKSRSLCWCWGRVGGRQFRIWQTTVKTGRLTKSLRCWMTVLGDILFRVELKVARKLIHILWRTFWQLVFCMWEVSTVSWMHILTISSSTESIFRTICHFAHVFAALYNCGCWSMVSLKLKLLYCVHAFGLYTGKFTRWFLTKPILVRIKILPQLCLGWAFRVGCEGRVATTRYSLLCWWHFWATGFSQLLGDGCFSLVWRREVPVTHTAMANWILIHIL